MITLCLDSSGKSATVVLAKDEDLLYSTCLNTGLTHSETLLSLIQQALHASGLTPQDIDQYGICTGPGSFTGLRIGIALVKGLAFSADTPCVPLSTLHVLACGVSWPGIVISALDARRGEVYWAAFENGVRLTPDRAEKADQVATFASTLKKPVLFVGDGAGLCYNKLADGESFSLAPPPLCHPTGAGLLLASRQQVLASGTVSSSSLEPQYLRLSQAERERAQRLSKS